MVAFPHYLTTSYTVVVPALAFSVASVSDLDTWEDFLGGLDLAQSALLLLDWVANTARVLCAGSGHEARSGGQ
jgi:hypothetical protein